MTPALRERAAAWCGLGCLQFFLCEQLAQLGWTGHYSLRRDYISNLGASSLCAAHALMNASFLAQAGLIAAAALLLPSRCLPALARGFLLFSAVGLAMVATHPADRDANTHIGGARIHFICAAAGLLAAGLAGRRPRLSIPAAGVAIAGCLLFGLGSAGLHRVLGPGLLERMAAYPLPLWLAATGYGLLRRPPARL